MRPQEIIDDEREHGRAFGPLAEACRLGLAKGIYCECREPLPCTRRPSAEAYCWNCERLIDFPSELLAAITGTPTCLVCGGPDEEGRGCEHCPKVTR